MKRIITYDYKEMKRVGQLLELLTFKGMDNARVLSEIGNILDSGILEEINEEKENNNE